MTLQELLVEHRDDIVTRFVNQVERKDLSPPDAPRASIVDHIPSFLDEVAAELDPGNRVRFTLDALDMSPTARRHGGQRWNLGYDLDAVIREYGILRHAILDAAKAEQLDLSIDEFDVLAKCLNVGVAEAATAYAIHRDEQLNAQKADLEFLTKAGELLSSSLDYRSTLTRLTRLIVPQLADWCVVHLEGSPPSDMPIAHVNPDKVATLREIFVRFPPREDAPHGYPRVARTGESELIETPSAPFIPASTESPEHAELLRQIGTCSWLVVPLRVQASIFGALTFAWSESGRHYGPSELALAEELARRAAVAIDNARLYEQSREERARVEAATRAKDEFVAMVSHELRTPLTAIVGWLRLLRTGTLSDAKREHALQVIERNANAQSQLVSDLLDISKMIAGRIRINPSQVDLSNVIEMVLEDSRLALEAKRIDLRVDLGHQPAVIRGDGDRLQQVVWNLLTNAAKFTPKGGKVEVLLRRLDSSIELVVRDNGVGMPAEFIPHVFESFRQSETGTGRSHGGLGIGLSITKHLVDLHGGTIEAESDGPGRGATFTVRLPISPLVSTFGGVSKVPATTGRREASTAPHGLEGLRVLVVDDEEDARELIRVVLEIGGIEVWSAGNAEEALQALEGLGPDVLISDVGMPGEDGYALIRRVRALKQKELAGVPALALTAFARSEDRTQALLEGFNLYMPKPVEPADLLSAVADLAGRLPGIRPE
jgi:signal transduction histidine kinase/ActR/RegA family two-component response regulator